jgi:carbamoyl-phosphate synthase large subunit
VATAGTATSLRESGVEARVLRKQHEGRGPAGEPTTVDAILAGEIDLIVNTPYGVGPRADGYEIRTAAVTKGIPSITTVQGLAAAVEGIDAIRGREPSVQSLQEHARTLRDLQAAARGEGRK